MIAFICLTFLFDFFEAAFALPAPFLQHDSSPVSANVFESLEELARIVDISYCVGSTGIQKPFNCLSRCSEFRGFDLVTTWNTGPLLSDSCGYVAVSHEPFEKRVIVAFRGTYSIANTIADLSTSHAEYVPFPAANDSYTICPQAPLFFGNETSFLQINQQHAKQTHEEPECRNCTIHTGFLTSWQNTRCIIIPHVEQALEEHPDYKLVLVGHSLGGAVAAIAALEFRARGYEPYVTTFGEPRLGNRELNRYIDHRFNLSDGMSNKARFRRVTHVDDPVPLLPLEEWGYEMHAGEIFISKPSLPPGRKDVHACLGDADTSCISRKNSDTSLTGGGGAYQEALPDPRPVPGYMGKRYELGQLFFAHRDYFWRLGLCVPMGGPWRWNNEEKIDSLEAWNNNEL